MLSLRETAAMIAAGVFFTACGGTGDGFGNPGDGGGASGSSSGISSSGADGSPGGRDAGSSSGSGGSGSGGTSSSGSGSTGSSGGSSGSSSGGMATSAVSIVVEPSDNAMGLISAIQGAKVSIHMEMYLLSNTAIINALIAQSKAGLDVKVILNQTFPNSGSNSGSNAGVYSQLKTANVPVIWAPPGFTYTHEKCVIIDGATAWIMTMNATQTSAKNNREYLAIDTDAADVAEAEAIFEHDYANQSYTPSGNLVVSPTNSRADLTALIAMAKTSIDIEAEELTDTKIVQALESAAMGGVQVHIVMADASTTTQAAALKTAGAKLVVYSALYVHAKSIVVDGAYAYVGSENFSAGSLGYNRELGVITNIASEVQKVATTTASDFAAGTPQ